MKYSIAAVAAFALAFGGCSDETSQGNGNPSELGAAEAKLTLPAGFSLNTVTYQVSGNGVSRTADIDVTNSSVLRFRLGNLPVANGYTLTLAATTTGTPSAACAGTAGFNISNTDVSFVTMTLTCGGGVSYQIDDKGDITVSVNVVQADGTICPVVSGISALPLETAVGSSLKLEGFSSSAPSAVSWAGPGGTFSAATAAATDFLCTSGGLHTLTYGITKTGCVAASSYTVEVECTGAVVTPDAAVPDAAEPDAAVVPDAAVPDAAEPDAAVVPDAAVPDAAVDAAAPDAGPSACQSCILTACSTYLDINFVAPCFQNSTDNPFEPTGNPEVQPLFTQLCSDTVNCSLAAPSKCADDAVGPARCYCGNQTISACLAAGPVAGAECVSEWNAAAECPVGDFACTIGANFSDLSRPSGYANTIIECANASCGASCGLTP